MSAAYGPIQALDTVSLHVNTGEIVTLIGANGAGKSTLLMTIFGNPRAHQGRIVFEGREITHLPTHHIARLGVSQAPEGRRIFPDMTVAENLIMGLTPLEGISERPDGRSDEEMLDWIHDLFPRLKERANQRAGTLSGGEQQMLAIGRALMCRPRLLLLDEPSLGLAPLIIQQIFAALRAIAKQGTTIFLVEQNANQALRLADRGYVLVNGRITLSGNGRALLDDPEVRAAYLGGQ
ncbi:putative branched chain amino acid ABC transporter [Magnetofaba australis IT-1]|uniref:Putative branched chain amino acid ABC transporter n=1 Tax=Magnetofaba australis IT-1 TaxID=1434232 RepID=A0A1Y2K1E1_9PROT|nr:putative branched chain amino acid ABC transporter [Magnetofaba australis IT-1]